MIRIVNDYLDLYKCLIDTGSKSNKYAYDYALLIVLLIWLLRKRHVTCDTDCYLLVWLNCKSHFVRLRMNAS